MRGSRTQWERTWTRQRLEDAGEDVQVAVPPKCASADFVKASYWRARGNLDVSKERFISYPKAGRDGASELVDTELSQLGVDRSSLVLA